MSLDVATAENKVIHAALRVLCKDYDFEPGPYSDAEAEYAVEQLALAARDLVKAVDASDRKPVGW